MLVRSRNGTSEKVVVANVPPGSEREKRIGVNRFTFASVGSWRYDSFVGKGLTSVQEGEGWGGLEGGKKMEKRSGVAWRGRGKIRCT